MAKSSSLRMQKNNYEYKFIYPQCVSIAMHLPPPPSHLHVIDKPAPPACPARLPRPQHPSLICHVTTLQPTFWVWPGWHGSVSFQLTHVAYRTLHVVVLPHLWNGQSRILCSVQSYREQLKKIRRTSSIMSQRFLLFLGRLKYQQPSFIWL